MSKKNNLKKGIITTIIAAVIATGAAGIAHQLDINQGMNDNAINLTATTHENNPSEAQVAQTGVSSDTREYDISYKFNGSTKVVSTSENIQEGTEVVKTSAFGDFFNEINEGVQGDDSSAIETPEDETTGSATEDANKDSSEIENIYNGQQTEENQGGMNVNNPENNDETLVQPNPDTPMSPAENPSATQTQTGVENKNWVIVAIGAVAALAIAVVAAIGLSKGIKKIKEKAEENGITPASRQARKETKLNSQSKSYIANKELYEAQKKFMNATSITITTELDNANIKEIKEVKEEIQKDKLNIPETIDLTKAYASGSKHENPLKAVTDPSILKKGVKTEAKIAEGVLNNNTKEVNTNAKQREEIKKQLQYDDSIIYASEVPNMYESHNGKTEIKTLNLNRAVSNVNHLPDLLKITHAELPFAESTIRTCEIIITKKDGKTECLKCAFNNEIGYNVLKSALILQAATVPEINTIEISEQINKAARRQPIVFKEPGMNKDFRTLVNKSEQYLDRFTKMYKAEIKTEQPQNSINQDPFNF